MPPKPKFTREEIVAAALGVVSKQGADALTAKELGDALGSSSRPIFTVFTGMGEVQQEVRAAAMRRFEDYVRRPQPDIPLFKQVGMQMVRFAMEEPKLFQLLFMQERGGHSFGDLFAALGPTAEHCMELLRSEYGLDGEAGRVLFENVWIYTFGVGALCATGGCRFSEAQLGQMLTAEFQAMLGLLRSGALPQ